MSFPLANNPANAAFSEVPTDNNVEAAALADTSLVASGKISLFGVCRRLVAASYYSYLFIHSLIMCCTTHIYLFICSLYSCIMRRTTCTNRHLGAAAVAVAVAADAPLAEASIELPPANNPANAAFS